MTFVSSWLLQIVLILLFAVVMDLIIPTSSMRNYVKLVMGFVIMVTMLKPISILYDNKFDISQIKWPEQVSQFASVEQIQAKASDMEREQMKQAETNFNENLKKSIKNHVENSFPVQVTKIESRFSESAKNKSEPPQITKLDIWIANNTRDRLTQSVQPIQPIDIQIQQSDDPVNQQPVLPEQEKLPELIKQSLSAQFEISGSLITVQWNEK